VIARYPSDPTDAQWSVLEPEARGVMAELVVVAGRPMVHDLRNDDVSGFVVLPRRWVVERTFAWLMRYRRLVRCYERRPEHHQAMLLWATIHLMTRRLARELAGQPPARDGAAQHRCPS
jgi:hypothetical protein